MSVLPGLRSRETSTRSASVGSSPALWALASKSASMYCPGRAGAAPACAPRDAGQPPRHMARARSSALVEDGAVGHSLSNSPASDTVPSDMPLSNRLRGRMWILAMRPAPLWDTLALSADEDPVRMYCPRLLPLSSTARRTASHIFGTFCHSSMTWGRAPVSAKPASISTARRTASLSMWTMLSPARDSTMSFRNISPPSPSRLRIPQGGGL